MPIPATVGAFAIVPHNDLAAAIPFWERLGFTRVGGDAAYAIMTGWGCEVNLTQAGSGPWRVPEEHNPFGVFIRTPEVEAIAALRAADADYALSISGIAGPDGMLIRIGWPSRLMEQPPSPDGGDPA